MIVDGDPGTRMQAASAVERRPSRSRPFHAGLGLDRGVERGVVERRFGLGGHR